MVQEGLREIYSLFIEKINSTFNQINEKLLNNPKFQNASTYFFKDFPFFYFCVKFYSLNLFQLAEFERQEFEDLKSEKFALHNNYKLLGIKTHSESSSASIISINLLKNKFVEKFSNACGENFSRTFNLIKLIEKSFDTNFSNFSLLKETIANDNITLYLINYIKQMSWSFVDLTEEFNICGDQSIILDSDFFLFELACIFSEKLNQCYFEKIKLNLDELYKEIECYSINIKENNYSNCEEKSLDKIAIASTASTDSNKMGDSGSENKKNINLLVFKYFYYLNILNKMNDVLLNFQTSNIRFLITENLKESNEQALYYYLQLIFNDFLKRLMKELKFILINKDFGSL